MKGTKRTEREIVKDLKRLAIELIEGDYTEYAVNPRTGQVEFLSKGEKPRWKQLSKREAKARVKQMQ